MTISATRPQPDTDWDQTASTPGYPGRRKRRLGKVLAFVLAAVTVVAIGAGTWGATSWSKTAQAVANIDKFTVTERSFTVELKEKGELKAANSVDIKCEVEGRSTIISLVDEGTAVKEGDLLVELASDQLDSRIRQEELKEATAVTNFEAAKTDLDIQRDRNASDIRKGELEVELKKLALDKYNEGDWQQASADAVIAIDQAKIMLERREEDYKAAKELKTKGFITQTKYEEDEFNFKKAGWDLEKAILAQKVLLDYTHIADSRQRESDVQEAIKELERIKKNATSEEAKKVRQLEGRKKELEITREELAKLREQKEKCRITAPTQGFVVYFAGRGRFMSSDGSGQVKEGASVHERQVLMQLPDTSEMLVVVRIHEAKTDKISMGQRVTIEVEGMPDRQFSGTVTKIAVLADTQNRWLNPDLKEYETEITLDPADVPLKPGVTAHARILVEDVPNVTAVPVQSIYTKAGRRYAFVANGSEIEPRQVELGSIGSEWAQITDGLAVSDKILLAFDEDHLRLVPDLPPLPRRNGGPPKAGSPQARPAGAKMKAPPTGSRQPGKMRGGGGRHGGSRKRSP